MTQITRKYELDMGHCLPEHGGKCYRPHGHRYVVEATVQGDVVAEGEEQGMVADFARLKAEMADVLEAYDHRFVMAVSDPRRHTAELAFTDDSLVLTWSAPTAENLAELWGETLAERLDVTLVRLRVYETPNCWADWEP